VADAGNVVVTSIPFVSRTRATLRSAEFGFWCLCIHAVQTPRRCGEAWRAGDAVLYTRSRAPLANQLIECRQLKLLTPSKTFNFNAQQPRATHRPVFWRWTANQPQQKIHAGQDQPRAHRSLSLRFASAFVPISDENRDA